MRSLFDSRSICGFLLISIGFFVVGCDTGGPAANRSAPPPKPSPDVMKDILRSMSATPLNVAPVREPPTEPAAAAAIDDEASVIGLSLRDQSRAFVVSSLSQPFHYVILTRLKDIALAVTYCDRTSSARVLARGDGEDFPDVRLGGWCAGKMLLQIDGEYLPQDTDECPYADVPFEVTTWGKWKEAHPETDVFTGDSAAAPKGASDSPSK
jgi:hypothetical protein